MFPVFSKNITKNNFYFWILSFLPLGLTECAGNCQTGKMYFDLSGLLRVWLGRMKEKKVKKNGWIVVDLAHY